MDVPALEELDPVQQPPGPPRPAFRHVGQDPARYEIEPAVAVPRQRRRAGPVGHRHLLWLSDAGCCEHGRQHLDRRVWQIDRCHSHVIRRDLQQSGIFEDEHIRVAQHVKTLEPLRGETQRTGDLVAVRRAGVERADGIDGHAPLTEILGHIGPWCSDDVHRQIAGVDPGDSPRRGEPPDGLEREARMRVHNARQAPTIPGVRRRPALRRTGRPRHRGAVTPGFALVRLSAVGDHRASMTPRRRTAPRATAGRRRR